MPTRPLVTSTWLVLIGLLVCAAAPASAIAQTSAEAEARALFEAGRTAYEAGRYEDALDHFQRAFDLSGRPELLFNIANAADRLRDTARALAAYRAYLAAMPGATNREMVERRIAFLETDGAEPTDEGRAEPGGGSPDAGPTTDAAVTTSDETAGATERRARMVGDTNALPWIALGGGALIAVGGAILLVLARVDADAVEAAPTGTPWLEVAGAAERVPVLYAGGGIALGVGVAAAAGSLAWALSVETPADAQVVVGPARLGLQVAF